MKLPYLYQKVLQALEVITERFYQQSKAWSDSVSIHVSGLSLQLFSLYVSLNVYKFINIPLRKTISATDSMFQREQFKL